MDGLYLLLIMWFVDGVRETCSLTLYSFSGKKGCSRLLRSSVTETFFLANRFFAVCVYTPAEN